MHTGYSQYPSIYVGEEHIGGIDDLRSHLLDDKSRERLFRENGIIHSSISTTDISDNDDHQLYSRRQDPNLSSEMINMAKNEQMKY